MRTAPRSPGPSISIGRLGDHCRASCLGANGYHDQTKTWLRVKCGWRTVPVAGGTSSRGAVVAGPAITIATSPAKCENLHHGAPPGQYGHVGKALMSSCSSAVFGHSFRAVWGQWARSGPRALVRSLLGTWLRDAAGMTAAVVRFLVCSRGDGVSALWAGGRAASFMTATRG